MLAANAARGTGKRGFGVWLDNKLAGYVDCDPDLEDLPEDGDVNLAYAVHPWARRRGVAVSSILLICDYVSDKNIGSRAIIRVDPLNTASVGVARRSGFELLVDAGHGCGKYYLFQMPLPRENSGQPVQLGAASPGSRCR